MPIVEIDGRQIEVQNGATVMDAANALGIAIPHFCYHKKLTIAANCRMCLVQVEKAPKPLPACATPVTDGMKVFTDSEYAKTAQKSVMARFATRAANACCRISPSATARAPRATRKKSASCSTRTSAR